MKQNILLEALNYVDDRFLDEVNFAGSKERGMRSVRARRRTFALAFAAALLLALSAAAYATSHPEIFRGLMARATDPEEQAFYENAAQSAAAQEEERLTIPGPDPSALMLYERYYDGENLLIGFRLEELTAAPVVGYELDAERLLQLKSIPGNYAFFYSEDPDESLDHELESFARVDDAQYGISPEEYNQWMEGRSERAKKADLRNMSSITMDLQLRDQLSPEDYDRFWELLLENGRACVVFPTLSPSDHVRLADGTELGAPGWVDVNGASCLEIRPVCEEARDRESLDIRFKVFRYLEYWYMELDGHAYIYYERDDGTDLSFVVERTK